MGPRKIAIRFVVSLLSGLFFLLISLWPGPGMSVVLAGCERSGDSWSAGWPCSYSCYVNGTTVNERCTGPLDNGHVDITWWCDTGPEARAICGGSHPGNSTCATNNGLCFATDIWNRPKRLVGERNLDGTQTSGDSRCRWTDNGGSIPWNDPGRFTCGPLINAYNSPGYSCEWSSLWWNGPNSINWGSSMTRCGTWKNDKCEVSGATSTGACRAIDAGCTWFPRGQCGPGQTCRNYSEQNGICGQGFCDTVCSVSGQNPGDFVAPPSCRRACPSATPTPTPTPIPPTPTPTPVPTPTPTPIPGTTAWFQTRGGDVHANGKLRTTL